MVYSNQVDIFAKLLLYFYTDISLASMVYSIILRKFITICAELKSQGTAHRKLASIY